MQERVKGSSSKWAPEFFENLTTVPELEGRADRQQSRQTLVRQLLGIQEQRVSWVSRTPQCLFADTSQPPQDNSRKSEENRCCRGDEEAAFWQRSPLGNQRRAEELSNLRCVGNIPTFGWDSYDTCGALESDEFVL